jgi:hypothetical protein
MRLGRSVLAGLVAGSVAGFLVELLRPRGTHPVAPLHQDLPGGGDTPWTAQSSRSDVSAPPAAPRVVPSMAVSREPATPVPGPGLPRALDDAPGTHD